MERWRSSGLNRQSIEGEINRPAVTHKAEFGCHGDPQHSFKGLHSLLFLSLWETADRSNWRKAGIFWLAASGNAIHHGEMKCHCGFLHGCERFTVVDDSSFTLWLTRRKLHGWNQKQILPSMFTTTHIWLARPQLEGVHNLPKQYVTWQHTETLFRGHFTCTP